jgi:DNA-binding NarL/FixJ family response regulator
VIAVACSRAGHVLVSHDGPEMPDNGWRRTATESSAPSGHHGGAQFWIQPLTSSLYQLTAREIQRLKLVVEGRTSKEIARVLGLRGIPALMQLAIRFGLIDLR